MDLTGEQHALLAALADGLPLVAEPYAALGQRLGWSEAAVLDGIRTLVEEGVIKRFGVVVRHHELGYRANAMVVFDLPDDELQAAARILAARPAVTLCYRRPRRLPRWPYNLFCMIHGRDRARVLAEVEAATTAAGIAQRPRAVLFSKRRFKQQAARYGGEAAA